MLLLHPLFHLFSFKSQLHCSFLQVINKSFHIHPQLFTFPSLDLCLLLAPNCFLLKSYFFPSSTDDFQSGSHCQVFKVLERRKTPLFAASYYLHYLHSLIFILHSFITNIQHILFLQSLHNISLTQLTSCLSSIQFSSPIHSIYNIVPQSQVHHSSSNQVSHLQTQFTLQYSTFSIYTSYMIQLIYITHIHTLLSQHACTL